MTHALEVGLALIAAFAVVNIPFLLFLLKGSRMPVSQTDQAQLDRIEGAVTRMAADAQNAVDTTAALTALADKAEALSPPPPAEQPTADQAQG